MRRKTFFGTAAFAIFLLATPSLSDDGQRAMLNGDSQLKLDRLNRQLTDSKDVLHRLLTSSDGEVPQTILKASSCVAVLPNVLKAAFVAGGEIGHGVVSCRVDAAGWSKPAFVDFGAASVGYQIGANSTDLVLFFVGEKVKRSLFQENFTLGADAEIAAGPIGRNAEANINLAPEMNRIYSYSNTSGIYAGVSLKGGLLTMDRESNSLYYGGQISAQAILSDAAEPASAAARAFMHVIP